jgi:Flp pilus assembly protein TadD
MRSSARLVLPAGLIVFALACASTYMAQQQAADAIEAGQPERAIEILAPEVAEHPANSELRKALADAYYLTARQALEAREFEKYERNLGLALDEWIAAVRLDPEDPAPHTMMAIVALHQGHLDSSITSLKNAQRLAPMNPLADSNLAEAYVYQGDFRQARKYLSRARKSRMVTSHVEIIESLAAWKTGDMTEARDIFASAHAVDPGFVETWNDAPVTEPIQTFDDFAAFCCGDIACGPYMANACHNLRLDVKERNVSAETVRKELVLEMQKRRELEKIYKGRRDLDIEVDAAEDVD